MRFAVAVVSPPGYAHSAVFAEVAEGLHYALLALGYDSLLTDRLDLDDRRTILLGSNLLDRFALTPPKDPIIYNLEQFDDARWITPTLLDLFRRYPVWDYSQANIERLTSLGVPRPAHVPIGYVRELTRIVPGPEDIDVLFYGSTNDRRLAVLNELRARGLRVEWVFGEYGAARDARIARSKLILNLHRFDQGKVFEIARVSYLLANKRAVVSERSPDLAQERDFESGVAFAEYDHLVNRCLQLLGDENARRDLAERGHQIFAARSQAVILAPILSAALR